MKKRDILISIAIVAAAVLLFFLTLQSKGQLNIDTGGAVTTLQLKSKWFGKTTVSSNDQPCKLSARVHRPQWMKVSMRQGNDTWQLESRGPWGSLSKIKVNNNDTTDLQLGPPLEIEPKVHYTPSRVSVDFNIIGKAGEHYRNFIMQNNKRIPEPKVKIVDQAGNVLASGKFEYGWGGTCRYSWRVPDDFKGKYQVQVDVNLGPFETIQHKTWHLIE